MYLLNHRAVIPRCTKVLSPEFAERCTLKPSGSSRTEVISHIHFPDLRKKTYSFPFGFSNVLFIPSSVHPDSPSNHFCFACCCFFFKIHILFVLAIPVSAQKNKKLQQQLEVTIFI